MRISVITSAKKSFPLLPPHPELVAGGLTATFLFPAGMLIAVHHASCRLTHDIGRPYNDVDVIEVSINPKGGENSEAEAGS